MRCSKCGSVEVEKIASKTGPEIWHCKFCDNLMIETDSGLEDYKNVDDEIEKQTPFDVIINYLHDFPDTYKEWIKHPLSIVATVALGFFFLLILIISSNTNQKTGIDVVESKEIRK